ncbi:zinc-dependent alcohol dehydrogenase [Phaeacidiphilus oryzae]|uniref:zinc-dependent alcohol dehydrogenase n=1 Tax=Phaeacidiphilus oryzae TaxID=348818 RepID=UPI000566A2CA|nr:zinc-binding dehydrogenase [Phaeacidiphilus oryzae]
MRAAFVPEPGRVEVADFPVPRPRPDQLLVRMRHASVCGSDIHVVHHGFHDEEFLGVPGYPGHEGVGVIDESSGDAGLPPGTPVLTVPSGRLGCCFAEYQAVERRWLIPLPAAAVAETGIERLLLAQQLGTTVFALKRFLRSAPGARDGEGGTAAVIGAGSAGLFLLQLLLRRGYDVVAVSDLDEGRLAEAARLGAARTVRAPGEDFTEAVLEATGGRGADLVIEAAGFDATRAQAVAAVRKRGTVGCFGYPELPGLSPFPVDRAFRDTVAVEWCSGAQFEPGLASFREALTLIRTGAIAVDHCLRARCELEQVPKALELARTQAGGAPKVHITIAPNG